MWHWRRSRLVSIGVSAQSVALAYRTSSSASIHMTEWSLDELAQGLTPHRGARAKLAVDDRNARLWMVDPPRGTASLTELEAIVRASFTRTFGEAPDQWHVGANWHASQPFMCCAVPVSLVQPVVDALANAGIDVVNIDPAFAYDWNALPSISDGWWCRLSPRHAVLTRVSGQRVLNVRSVYVEDDRPLQRCVIELKRYAMRLGQASPTHLSVIDAMNLLPEGSDGIEVDGVCVVSVDRSSSSCATTAVQAAALAVLKE
ncbi:MAG TPA: hypothetical protein VFS42_11075 [Burkholderiaceae bacterium]|nr:hypothetical protein [Burkholderiaceae bacterium]